MAKEKFPQFHRSRDIRGAGTLWSTPQASVILKNRFFGAAEPLNLSRTNFWTGSALVPKVQKVWDGTAWMTGKQKSWDGSAWVPEYAPAPVTLNSNSGTKSLTQSTAGSITLATGVSGTISSVTSVTPALPAGLTASISSGSLIVSGTATVAAASAAYAIVCAMSDAGSKTYTLTLTVTAAVASYLKPALVQNSGAKSGSASTTKHTWSTAPVVGNTITVEVMTWTYGADTSHTVSDDAGNVYTQDASALLNVARVSVFSAVVASVPTNTTITHSSSGGNSASFSEWSGVAAFDTSATANTDAPPATSFPVGPTGTLAQPDELVISAFGFNSGSGACGIATPLGYTPLAYEQDSNSYIGFGAGYLLTSDTAALSAAWTVTATSSVSNSGARCIATYRAAAAPN